MPTQTVDGVTTGLRKNKDETPEEMAERAERERAVRFQLDETEKGKLAAQGGRTDEEITLQAPLVVMLDGKEVVIPLLSFNKNKVWRVRYREHLKEQCKLRDLQAKAGKPEEVSFEALALTEKINTDDHAEMLVLYMGLSGTGDESILDHATAGEVDAAFKAVEKVASPFV